MYKNHKYHKSYHDWSGSKFLSGIFTRMPLFTARLPLPTGIILSNHNFTEFTAGVRKLWEPDASKYPKIVSLCSCFFRPYAWEIHHTTASDIRVQGEARGGARKHSENEDKIEIRYLWLWNKEASLQGCDGVVSWQRSSPKAVRNLPKQVVCLGF